jgi:hypothetical protein
VSNDATQTLLALALRDFFRLAEEWKLSEPEQLILLGSPKISDFQDWRIGDVASANGDVIERISLMLRIYWAICTLLPTFEQANLWMRAPNAAPMFAGKSALDYVLRGGIAELRQVWAYLDAQRG